MPEALTEGERWTRQELERLLEARFSPSAIARFLEASFDRSAEVREARPDIVRQSRRWMAAGAAAYLGVPGTGTVGAAAWWAATAVMLDWHLGMFETPDGEPRPLGPADAATLTRAWLVPVVSSHPTAAVCAIGGLTDVLDGRLARATKPTRAGRDLEGLVDACFVVAALRGLARQGRLPRAVLAAEGARVAGGFAYGCAAYFSRAERPRDDLLHAARATTVLRIGGVALAAAGRRRPGGAAVAAGCALSLALGARAAFRAGSASPAA